MASKPPAAPTSSTSSLHQQLAEPAYIDPSEPSLLAALRFVREQRAASIAAGALHVSLAWAQTLDGCVAERVRTPTKISGELSHRLTHLLRREHDAILVGVGTVIADNPRLNVRLAHSHSQADHAAMGGSTASSVPYGSPIPVILDPHMRTPLDAALLTDPSCVRPFLFVSPPRGGAKCGEEEQSDERTQDGEAAGRSTAGRASECADEDAVTSTRGAGLSEEEWHARAAALEARGCRVVTVRTCDASSSRFTLFAIASALRTHVCARSVMIEGGPTVLRFALEDWAQFGAHFAPDLPVAVPVVPLPRHLSCLRDGDAMARLRICVAVTIAPMMMYGAVTLVGARSSVREPLRVHMTGASTVLVGTDVVMCAEVPPGACAT